MASHATSVTNASRGASSGKTADISLTPERIAEKLAVREMVRGAGGVEAAAPYCRVGKSQLARYYDPTCDEHVPLDVIADLEPLARSRPGWPHVTRMLARRNGFVMVAAPEAACSGDLHEAFASATKEHADVATGLIQALADGAVSPAEAKSLLKDSWEQVEAAMRLHVLLEQIAEHEG